MSNPRVDSFFSVFEKSVQDEIMAFCKRITSTHSDVYVIMARKAAVFCDCLEELGLIHLEGYVTSDRSLDINGEWLEGKEVTIIDDAVVSGTTLYTTIQKILLCGAKNISVQILTVNEAWYNPTLLQDEAGNSYVFPVYNKLPDNLCIKLCNDIVHAISLVPRPYDIDFPLYKSIRLTEYEMQRILVLNNWETYDLRTDLQKQHDIVNFTLLPNRYELHRLSEIFGLNVTQHCNIKIRIYGRLLSRTKKQYALRISPFVIFHEMSVETAQQIFDSIISNHGKVDATLFADWNSSSQLRFLQFYYSHQLASFWLYRISHLLTEPFELTYSYRNLSFLFPEEYIFAVEVLNKRFVRLSPDILPTSDATLRSHEAYSVYQTIDPISINARLYEPFLEMYHEKELPCRRLVAQEGKEVFQHDQYKKLRNRLNEGLSFQDLEQRLSDCVSFYDIGKKVSLFIDYSIDAGIIVPIIQQEGRAIFRAYRHGEDVLFGRREEIMYIKMLSVFSQYAGSVDGISKISAEKMIVLFSKIGLREKILYPYTSNFNAEPLDSSGLPMKILRVKPYLKGPVALVGSAQQFEKTKYIPFITNERKSMWLTNVLIQSGQLTPNSKQKKYLVKDLSTEADISLLTEPELTFLHNFAELTGRVSNPAEKTGISFSDNDWAKVSVTLTLPDTVTAVAAEIEIFSNDFSISSLIDLTGNKHKDMKQIKYFCGSHAFESVHNAIMKINSFSTRRGQELIRSVRFPSSIEQRIWLSYFSEELNNDSDDNNAMLTIIYYEQKVWAHLISALVNTLFIRFTERYAGRYGGLPVSQSQYDRARERQTSALHSLDDLKSNLPTNAGDAEKMFDLYGQIRPRCTRIPADEAEFRALFLAIQKVIGQIEGVASNIEETVCDVLGEKGKIHEIIRFNHVMHVSLSACSSDKRAEACRHIEQAYRDEQQALVRIRQTYLSKGEMIPPLEIRELPQKYKPYTPSDDAAQDMWFMAHGLRIDQQMAFFAKNIFYRLYRNNIDCKITIFEKLSYENCIKSNSSEFAECHCNQFNTFIEQFKKDIVFPQKSHTPCILHICPSHLLENSRCQKEFEKDEWYQSTGSFDKAGPALSKTSYRITEYVCTAERRIEMDPLPAYDFGIITILPEEMDAAKQVLSLRKLPYKFGERIYYAGKVEPQGKTEARRVICTQTIDQGERSVINAYHNMMDKYRPKFIFLIGIAGSILNNQNDKGRSQDERLELDLCDVVIAKSVIDYELRKETDKGVEHRGRVFDVSAESALIVNDFLVMLETTPLAATEGSKNDMLHVLFEPIGSGNAVIGNELSEIVTWLKNVNSKVAAVEMEASGISSAFYESRLSDHAVQGLLVIRGISDMANVDKARTKAFRKPAAQNAALVTKKLMEIFPDF